MEMEQDYKCGICNTYTVTEYTQWAVPGNSYDEILYHLYVCNKCNSEESQPAKDHVYKEGDTIFF
jgi:hypothetical protein